MTKKRVPYLLSVIFHLILAGIFYFIKIGLEPVVDEYVTIGFGAVGELSSSGVLAEQPVEEVPQKRPEENKKTENKVVKKVELPKVENSENDNNVITASDKNISEEETKPENVKPIVKTDDESGKGKEEAGEGEGKFGFEIDFGGRGIRKIFSYSLPEYPSGVSKEIDVKLKFSILPDGTVGKIIPLIKADSRLELAAINSLRQWRFEPLPNNQKVIEQFAVIIFPFRLQ